VNVFTHYLPVKIVFGSGSSKDIGQVLRDFGCRGLLITDRNISKIGMAETMAGYIRDRDIELDVYNQVDPSPSVQAVDKVVSDLRQEKFDFIVALGGGSVIDFSKAVSVIIKQEGKVWDYVAAGQPAKRVVNKNTMPVIAIPTTAGTGSEVTPYSVLTNKETDQKASLKSPFIFPRFAVVDPELTLSMPPGITAISGIDALAHAIEAYINIEKSTPMADMAALESIRIIGKYLSPVVENGKDLAGRENMAWAAMLSGMAISGSDTTTAHALSVPLCARTGMPHGLAAGVLTSEVIRRSAGKADDKFRDIARAMKIDLSTVQDDGVISRLADEINTLTAKIGLKNEARRFFESQEAVDIDILTSDVLKYQFRSLEFHPKLFNRHDITAIYRSVFN